MKLNNKGFAISTIMYIILVLAVILITLSLSMLSSRRLILDKIRQESLNNVYDDTLKMYEPQYYSWFSLTSEGLGIGDVLSDDKKSQTPPAEHPDFYLGFNVDDDSKVTSAYICFKRNENQYCLKGFDKYARNKNNEIIKEAFSDIINQSDSCSESQCTYGTITVTSGVVRNNSSYCSFSGDKAVCSGS